MTGYSGSLLTQGNFTVITSFYALAPSFTGGVRVGFTQALLASGSPGPALLTAAGPGGGPQVDEFDAQAIFSNPNVPVTPLAVFESPPGNFTNGIFVSV